jgi:hypothetical protein
LVLVSLPKVSIFGESGEGPVVTVNGTRLSAVRAVSVLAERDRVAQVSVTFMAEVDLELPARVTVVRTGGASASEFAARLDPTQLEAAAAGLAGDDLTMGEALARAVAEQAARFDAGD